MPQTTYSLDHVAAVAGQVVSKDRTVGKYAAAEEIPPGRLVVLNSDGALELPQDTTLAKAVGVSMYRDAKEPGPWAVGDFVPVLRQGVIWAEFSGGTAADLAEANVKHSSTISTHRGKFSASSVSSGTGTEISDPGPCLFYSAEGPTGLAQVECAFPGNADATDDSRLDDLEAVMIQKKSVTVLYTDLVDGDDGDAQDVNVGTALPAGAFVVAAKYTINTPFAGAGVATLTMIVGKSGDTNGVIEAVDILGDAAGQYQGTLGTMMVNGPSLQSEVQLVANFDPDASAGLDELTAGSVTIDVFYFAS